ncbi:hypothetical protein H113_06333 [Trichophyton rubrum MR1459]|uniref:Uncharacterized protein n=1 Tax=Trichophyton rubrum (strain ATCC MYA-4607 / CBS 118892) TaxID=559305 RepID=A0A080WEP9_TRIRC|nr:uncharacterized protein TERG_11743 [Trichophyton rubrum CBS 118892]EZF92892.1 hypothetical protein H113_06333 [Trichophyton rubrum MR1459]EZG03904.1 hypothetical protein H106_06130 [Trichophyton rubrum CBS 735.88]KFL60666.1 hypothetical protein TERG_11743 [Trichophyton rubrum CBS 118892]
MASPLLDYILIVYTQHSVLHGSNDAYILFILFPFSNEGRQLVREKLSQVLCLAWILTQLVQLPFSRANRLRDVQCLPVSLTHRLAAKELPASNMVLIVYLCLFSLEIW